MLLVQVRRLFISNQFELNPPVEGKAPKNQAMIIIEALKAKKEPTLVLEG